MNQTDLVHLYWRAGFGAKPSLIADSKKLSKIYTVNRLFDTSKKTETIKVKKTIFFDSRSSFFTLLPKIFFPKKTAA